MLVNADFSQRAIVMPHQYQWIASPNGEVDRAMLDRLGGENTRATSIVRYGPGASFPRHQHPGGEEILVLSGTFSEGGKHYPAGWYLRNPPGSSHAPSSADGATIFVKLRQMAPFDSQSVRIDTRDMNQWQSEPNGDICLLYVNEVERVRLHRLRPSSMLPVDGAMELLILDGDTSFEGVRYSHGTWMRLPVGDQGKILAGTAGAKLYVKSGLFERSDAEPNNA
ncbi:cupin domain-containing protein [Cupriavidus sp. BIC8F]|uniref:cupin domain-containing protein n=1 Tax=Cupriavidus sp. BIC8F TaxID=3079014 RepID=UPI0029165F47|nr:cupin domain-containing protein [Cupriavidus sp. BIC8F]